MDGLPSDQNKDLLLASTANIQNEIDFMGSFILEKLINQYDQGDYRALFDIMVHCIWLKIELPERFEIIFVEAVNKWKKAEVQTLDEAFNVVPPKGKHKSSVKQSKRLKRPVFVAVSNASKSGAPIDEGLFEKVGALFNISGAYAKKLYYEEKADREADDKIILDTLFKRFKSAEENGEIKQEITLFLNNFDKL
jgi:hypothetical protein